MYIEFIYLIKVNILPKPQTLLRIFEIYRYFQEQLFEMLLQSLTEKNSS